MTSTATENDRGGDNWHWQWHVVAVGASAPAASAAKGPPTPKANHFRQNSSLITNSWFPLARGSVYVYDGQKDGKQARDVMTVTARTKTSPGSARR